jgi:hypothetical protein
MSQLQRAGQSGALDVAASQAAAMEQFATLVEMLRDWGTCLELALYYQAFIHLLGGDAMVTHQLPMQRAGIPLGNQRFHLLEPDAAFRFTAFGELTVRYEKQIQNLLRLSPLKVIHWINIGHEEVTLTTIA